MRAGALLLLFLAIMYVSAVLFEIQSDPPPPVINQSKHLLARKEALILLLRPQKYHPPRAKLGYRFIDPSSSLAQHRKLPSRFRLHRYSS
jgi:hypothetical protein